MIRRKTIITIILFVIICLAGTFIFQQRDNLYIETVLSGKAYSYLPEEAKEWVKDYYKKTGKVVLTEKNKQENRLYLNPQYVQYLTYSEEEKKNTAEIPMKMVVDYVMIDTIGDVSIPSSYDLRNDNEKNYVTPVRNQGNLGICWTFASAGIAESHILKMNDESYSESSKLISERQLDYATSRNGIYDYKNEYVSFINRSLGDGGNFYVATVAMASGISVIDYQNFKAYNDSDLTKMELSEVLSYQKSEYELNTTYIMPRLVYRESTRVLTPEEKAIRDNYLEIMKLNIMTNGAAYVGTYMNTDCMYADSALGNVVIDVYSCEKKDAHAMEIIGWDDDIEFSYCADNDKHTTNTTNCENVVSGRGVWILKNSWGSTLPNPYLAYDSGDSTISFIADMESTATKIWDNNYLLGAGETTTNDKTYTLNDTRIKNDEVLKKVKIIARTSGSTYTVKVTGKETTKSYSQQALLPGLITFDIDDGIIINKDSTIQISSTSEYIDKVMIFTSNIETTPQIDVTNLQNMVVSSNTIRLYSDTKNIASGTTLLYKLLNQDSEEVTNKWTITNNIVAENNINTKVEFSDELDNGTYTIQILKGEDVITSFNINYTDMEGTGTSEDPFIITTSTQLDAIRNNLSAYYELGNDVDLTEDTREGGILSKISTTCPQEFGWESISGFTGTLDGKGYAIKGLYQKNYLTCNEDKQELHAWTDTGNGLFNVLSANATIKNLVLKDFDITCQGGNCGFLASAYMDSGEEEHTATFENIVIQNSKISGVMNNDNTDPNKKACYGGGLFGSIESSAGNIILKNIYIDMERNTQNIADTGYLSNVISSKNTTIKNIRINGNIEGKYEEGNGDSILVQELVADHPVSIKNILSTITATNVNDNLIGKIWGSAITLDSFNLLRIADNPICASGHVASCEGYTNVRLYNPQTELIELTKATNYTSWDGFEDDWKIETIDNITRIPVLKFMNFDYTSIQDININQTLNEKISIYDYITPKIDAAKRIRFQSNNNNVVEITEDGELIPKANGNATIHVESLYDGYIKDVPVNVTYVPHYQVILNSNDGNDEEIVTDVNVGQNYTLPDNTFTRDHYDFAGWNTERDGSGIGYDDGAEIMSLADKASITLYAQWIIETRVINLDADGGEVDPNRIEVRYGSEYGNLPVPTKESYAFKTWKAGETPITSTSIVSSYTLKAEWEENAYNVIYNANGGTKDDTIELAENHQRMSDQTILTMIMNDGEYAILGNMYQKKGAHFKEWNTASDGTGTKYTVEQAIEATNVENNRITLYAIWENEMGMITFYANDGTEENTVQGLYFNTSTTLEKNTFTRAGYEFVEWNTEPDGTGDSYEDEDQITIDENIALYAIWEESFDYEINTYNVDTTNQRISKILINTTPEQLASHIQLNTGFTVDIQYKMNNSQKILYTGSKTRIYRNLVLYAEYENAVMGDINGDGFVNSGDLLRIRQHLLNIKSISGVYFTAADITYDNYINSADLLRMRQHLLGIKYIS